MMMLWRRLWNCIARWRGRDISYGWYGQAAPSLTRGVVILAPRDVLGEVLSAVAAAQIAGRSPTMVVVSGADWYRLLAQCPELGLVVGTELTLNTTSGSLLVRRTHDGRPIICEGRP